VQALEAAVLDLTEVAASPEPLTERAGGLLERLHRIVPFDSAWMAHVDPLLSSYATVATRDLDPRTRDYLAGPAGAHDIDAAGVNRPRSPLTVSDLPFPVQELETWSECLLPAGYQEALAVALYGSAGRHIGFLALLFEDRQPPTPRTRRVLQKLTSLLADCVDPVRSLLPTTRLIQGATAGVILRADGATQELPGLTDHELLQPNSDVLCLAEHAVSANRLHAAFLWPLGGDHAPHGHLQITVLATADVAANLTGMVLVSPPPDLRGLTPRELQILGLLIDGQSNAEIAHTLTVAPRTVAAHVEHILYKLDAPTRTLAAVRAERGGLYVPLIPLTGRQPRRGRGKSALGKR
jgi:DNA-binding CsgD family transcriptional regulator